MVKNTLAKYTLCLNFMSSELRNISVANGPDYWSDNMESLLQAPNQLTFVNHKPISATRGICLLDG